MGAGFLEMLMQEPGKRVTLPALRTVWLAAYPEQVETPDRDSQLLVALRLGEAQGLLRLPGGGGFERFGNPPMPLFITLVREGKLKETAKYNSVSWLPEIGFWPSLSLSEQATAFMINEWLIKRRGRFLQVPLRERSLDIFGDEKYLDARVRNGALFGGRMPLSVIGAMRVEHPLAYRPADAIGSPVLVVENHHTFWSLGEWNEQSKRYSAVIYGGGNTICASGLALLEVMREREAQGAEYFGDVDPEGFNIPLKFNRLHQLQLIPSIGFYQMLLRIGRRRASEVLPRDYQDLSTSWLPELAEQINDLWSEGFWLPQEGVGLEQLMAISS
ncbi:Wadjet anti-phage system protein JetD domain-containing protein [Pseudomonas sp. PS01300]|uniref:Wadjet anti-phage system protein JetD domain-containing protein n=1 Tax=Pseudomonas sp. PS01300 TaxID=2991436 RepID=UPI00249B7535|nr:Wadjet anti-phage system protein JetD domain-containing protein [Pseudomonas sp. PS01300]